MQLDKSNIQNHAFNQIKDILSIAIVEIVVIEVFKMIPKSTYWEGIFIGLNIGMSFWLSHIVRL